MQKIERPYEVLFRWNRETSSLDNFQVSGHVKTLTEILDDVDENGAYPVLSAKESEALPLEKGEAMLEEVVGQISSSLTKDVARLNAQVSELTQKGTELQEEYDKLLEEYTALSEQNLQSASEQDGNRILLEKADAEIQALKEDYDLLVEENLAAHTREEELKAEIEQLKQQ